MTIIASDAYFQKEESLKINDCTSPQKLKKKNRVSPKKVEKKRIMMRKWLNKKPETYQKESEGQKLIIFKNL